MASRRTLIPFFFPDQTQTMLTVYDLAELFPGTTETTWINHRENGTGPDNIVVDGRVYYPREHVEHWVDELLMRGMHDLAFKPRRGIIPFGGHGDKTIKYAVIVIVNPENGAVLLTKRAATLRQHAGEMCFPGGRLNRGETHQEAALRELEEETGITADMLTVVDVARLPKAATTYTTNKTFTVSYAIPAVPVDELEDAMELNPDEVESVKWFVPNKCVVDFESTPQGRIRIETKTGDEEVIGATADVLLKVFSTPLFQLKR